MKVLAIADRAPTKPLAQILAENPDLDIIITLWDLYYYDIQALADVRNIPKIGVYGNHCDGRYMETLGIGNLHLKWTKIDGISFMGYQWCVKYKESVLQSTQEECSVAMESAPRADVFISHCPPRWINNNDDSAHYGFEWLLEYIDRTSPKYFLHGHTYDDGKFMTRYKDTEIVYVHREAIINLFP